MTGDLPLEVSAAEVKLALDRGEAVSLIDVRELAEHALARIDSAELIPMNTIPASLSALEAKGETHRLVVFCHHGVRSLHVVNWLRQQGLSACQSMSGGINSWSAEIDPSVPLY